MNLEIQRKTLDEATVNAIGRIVDAYIDIEEEDWEESGNPAGHIYHSFFAVSNWVKGNQ